MLVTRRSLSKQEKARYACDEFGLRSSPQQDETTEEAITAVVGSNSAREITDLTAAAHPHFSYRATDPNGIVENEVRPKPRGQPVCVTGYSEEVMDHRGANLKAYGKPSLRRGRLSLRMVMQASETNKRVNDCSITAIPLDGAMLARMRCRMVANLLYIFISPDASPGNNTRRESCGC